MKSAELDQLLETAMRRPLTASEEARLQACLEADPSAKAVWEEEKALSQLLRGLPDTPLATNFTAQVLSAVERGTRRRRSRERGVFRWLGLRRPARQLAAACLVIGITSLSYWQYRTIQREKMALALSSVANNMDSVSDVASLPLVETWQDFDAINRLPRSQSDDELLSVLKELAMK